MKWAVLVLAGWLSISGASADAGVLAGAGVLDNQMKVYRSASCGCCKGWIDHIRENGIEVEDVVVEDVSYFKNKLGVPNGLRSCHTGVINGYAIEGHVPAADIKKLIHDKPQVTGLVVPHMPVGTPGMEMGDRKDPFDVISFDDKGDTQIFKQYRGY